MADNPKPPLDFSSRPAPKDWKPHDIGHWAVAGGRYPDEAIEAALDVLGLTDPSQRSDFNTKLHISISNFMLFQHSELRPGPAHIRSRLDQLKTTAKALIANIDDLDGAARLALENAVEAKPLRSGRDEELREPFSGPSADFMISYVQHLAATIMEWCDDAVDAQPAPQRGQPAKGALLDWAIVAANIFEEATGRRAGRNPQVVQVNSSTYGVQEVGAFRKFACTLLEPIGLSLSDGMAKQAIAAVAGK